MQVTIIAAEGIVSDPAWRWGADADAPVDLVAFNGYPDLPEELPNPPRRHAVLARIIVVLAGTLAMLVTAVLVPTAEDDLVSGGLIVGPLVAGGLLALAAWDTLVEHRRPALRRGRRLDAVERPADALIVSVPLIVSVLLRDAVMAGRSVGPDQVLFAVILAAVMLIGLAVWLVALGLGRATQRVAGERAASWTLAALAAAAAILCVVLMLESR